MKKISLLFTLFLITFSSLATHVVQGEINANHISGNDYLVTFKVLMDCGAIAPPSTVTLQASCSTSTSVTLPQIASYDSIGVNNFCDSFVSNSYCNGGSNPGWNYLIYSDTITLPSCSTWTISYSTCCRYTSNNLTSISYGYYVETKVNQLAFPNNSTPTFGPTPVLYVNLSDTLAIDYSAHDVDGDSLVYSFTSCLTSPGTNANYNAQYSALSPMGVGNLNYNPQTGVLSKSNSIVILGGYFIGLKVEEYDQLTGTKKGEVLKDIPIFVTNSAMNPYAAPAFQGVQSVTNATLLSGNSYSACTGNTVNFSMDFAVNSSNSIVKLWSDVSIIFPGATYTVQEGDTSSINLTIPTSNLAPGTYQFKVQAADDTCLLSSLSHEAFNLTVTGISSNGNQNICLGDSVQLSVAGSVNVTWTPASSLTCSSCPNPIAYPTQTTTYYVIDNNMNSCGMDSVVVTVNPGNPINAGPDQTICIGDSAQLNLTGGSNVSWYPFNTLTCDVCVNPIAFPTQTTTYVVFDTILQFCGSQPDTITITVNNAQTIYGQVTDPNGGILNGMNVYLIQYNPLDSTVSILDSTFSNAAGGYSFQNMDSNVFVKATPDSAFYPNLVPTYSDSASLFLNATPLIGNTCDTILANIYVQGGNNPGGSGFVSGNVYQGAGKTDGVGDPAVGVDLILMNLQNQEVKYWKTDANGHLQFTQLAFGTYKVYVDRLGVDNSQAPVIVVNEYSKDIVYDFKLNSKLLIRSSPNGIKDAESHFEFVVYPNPADNRIQLNITEMYDFEILSIDGKSLLNQENYINSSINVSSLNPGIYLIKVKVNDVESIQRFIKN